VLRIQKAEAVIPASLRLYRGATVDDQNTDERSSLGARLGLLGRNGEMAETIRRSRNANRLRFGKESFSTCDSLLPVSSVRLTAKLTMTRMWEKQERHPERFGDP
jgi:hypothetical protein